MAKSQAERSLAATAKRKRLGEEELRHPVQAGTRAQLAELMRWHGVSEKAEALQLLILNAHALGQAASAAWFAPAGDEQLPADDELRHRARPGTRAKLDELKAWHDVGQRAMELLIRSAHALGREASAACLAIPRHEITISESVARRLEVEGRRDAAALDRSDE